MTTGRDWASQWKGIGGKKGHVLRKKKRGSKLMGKKKGKLGVQNYHNCLSLRR